MAVLKDLIVHGPSRFVNVAQFNALKTNKLGAEEGIFNKLVATTGKIDSLDVSELTAGKATVLSLLDVRGELHTNQWTNSNIATIDGSFYITPTIGVSSGTIAIPSLTTMTINGSNFPVSSLYISTDATASTTSWISGSKVLVTGEILIDGVYMPLGTLVGVLDGNATATQIKIKSLTDNRYQSAASLAEIGVQTSAKTCRNVKVSLYQRANGSTLYPLGIYMTALGENGKTFIDMYGGGYATSTAVAGGFAKPALRIGNLAGLPAVGGQTPTGWGIYTSNGYFSGVISASKGYIGSYVIDGTYLQSSDKTTGIAIADNSTTADWAFWAGGTTASTAKFRVTQDGVLHASGAIIKGTVTVAAGSNVYTTDNVNPLNIGGKNLLVGTSANKSKATTSTTSYVTQALYDTPNQATLSALGFSVNDEVTLSFDWEITNATTYGNARIEWYGQKDSTSMTYIAPLINPFATFSASNTSGHVATTVKLTSATILSKRLVLRIDNSNLTLTISNLKLEKGNKATDWTPAPEDAETYTDNAVSVAKNELDQSKIDTVSDSTSLLENINAISDQITLLASKINFGNITVADNLARLNTAVSIDTNTSTIYVGDQNGMHLRLIGGSDPRLGFYQQDQQVAYINNNQLYINKSVVLQQMDVGTPLSNGKNGQWSWKVHQNSSGQNNLYLKWLG